ncbi:EAL domain-containing response regulator [Thalassotalea nanhaiensis]|uniref:EAL domain-containing response regulator n=1 Tax=Thalassotalea nanhaiensis TaxID=3065648 RepID=A0ABY9TJI6_9GAMM|nr:EAL domain-containing response regulator [Colwelliaceae bacterium SQ345]
MKIVIIEADNFQCLLLSRMIKRAGDFDVIAFSNVDDCLMELAITSEPTVIFSDINLPDRSGITLFRELKKNEYILGLVVVSALPEAMLESIKVLIGQFGMKFTHILNKPVIEDEINGIIHSIESFINYPKLSCADNLLTKDELQRAKYENSFHPYFQPQVNIRTGEIHGLEILGRIIFDGQLMLPETFIQPLTKFGMMTEYTLSILARAIHLLRAHGLDEHRISLNVEYGSLQEVDFAEKLLQVLRESAYPARQLTLEVTESKSSLSANVLYNLTELKLNSITLSIDNFGHGSSNIDELLNIPFSELKIDNRYTANMITSVKTKAVNQSINQLCKDLNIICIAQGVETEQQIQVLKALDVSLAQGFYFSPPIPAPKLKNALTTTREMMEKLILA